ncbi:MAG: LptF/LptG family permease [Parachlamydiaceae bacterium]
MISNFLRTFLLTVCAFLAILLASRLEEIAHFTSFGADFGLIAIFTLFQIPYILPIAIPIGCLIGSILLMQKLSSGQELTAIRASGFSLKEVAFPLLATAFLISIINFLCVSELATMSHHQSNVLKNELRSINPLLLLHNKHLMRTKGIYYESLGSSKLGQSASDILIGLPDQSGHALRIVCAKKLEITQDSIKADQLAVLTPFGEKKEGEFRNAILENIQKTEIPLDEFANLIEKKLVKVTLDSLDMQQLFQLRRELKSERNDPATPDERKAEIKHTLTSTWIELVRRFSLGFSPFTLTLLGIAFGVSISRLSSSWSLAFPIGLTALFLACFFAAKSLDKNLWLSMALYLAPQLLIIFASIRKMERISQGIE